MLTVRVVSANALRCMQKTDLSTKLKMAILLHSASLQRILEQPLLPVHKMFLTVRSNAKTEAQEQIQRWYPPVDEVVTENEKIKNLRRLWKI